jgi:hypothetical protein
MSFSDPRDQLHPDLIRDHLDPYVYFVGEPAHQRDVRRVLAEPWPFGDGPGSWTVPVPAYQSAQEFEPDRFVELAHPRSTQAIRARVKRSRQTEAYAAQASLYASTVSLPPQATSPVAEPTMAAGAATGDPVAEIGYAFHRLMEALGARRRH